MADETVITYGQGGFDTTKPSNNVVGTETVEIPPEVVNQRSIQSKAEAALALNNTYLAIASPTAAQNTAQVKVLTRENNALIRLALGLLEVDDA